jgi:hypothetical protein
MSLTANGAHPVRHLRHGLFWDTSRRQKKPPRLGGGVGRESESSFSAA